MSSKVYLCSDGLPGHPLTDLAVGLPGAVSHCAAAGGLIL